MSEAKPVRQLNSDNFFIKQTDKAQIPGAYSITVHTSSGFKIGSLPWYSDKPRGINLIEGHTLRSGELIELAGLIDGWNELEGENEL